MNIRSEVVSELQILFKEGATPSRLIRHIVERHEGERMLHSLIQAYFLEAFEVPIVRGLSPNDTENPVLNRKEHEKVIAEILDETLGPLLKDPASKFGSLSGAGGKSKNVDELKRQIHAKLVERLDFSRVKDPANDAFRRDIRRVIRHLCNCYYRADLRYAFLNEQLLHEMIEKRSDWDSNGDSSGNDTWLGNLSASDDHQRISQAQAVMPSELSRCWPELTPNERNFIHLSMASANGLFETVKILSRLVECLQQKIVELETVPAK